MILKYELKENFNYLTEITTAFSFNDTSIRYTSITSNKEINLK